MVFGTFDFLHRGHIALFEQAKRLGNELVVVVAQDKTSKQVKKRAPVQNATERMQVLRQVKLINRVVLGDATDRHKVIKRFKPNTILLGYDQRAFVSDLAKKIKEFGLTTKVVRAKAYKRPLSSRQLRKKSVKTL